MATLAHPQGTPLTQHACYRSASIVRIRLIVRESYRTLGVPMLSAGPVPKSSTAQCVYVIFVTKMAAFRLRSTVGKYVT
jgi:hypothetical protein